MLYTIPDYYHEFECTAAQCEDTCCAGWQIMIDKKSLEKYKKVPGHFGKRLRRSVDWREGAFKQSEDKRCAFLNRENLCDLYTALGKNSLCTTCRRYPRHVEEFENVREITLSVSCPEVAKILLAKTEPAQFLTYEKEGEEEFEEFDPFLYSVLVDGRETMMRILKNRELELGVRITLIWGLAHDMQRRVNMGEMFSCEELFERYESERAIEFASRKAKGPEYAFAKKIFRVLHRLEKLRDDWEPYLYETERLLFSKGEEEYDNIHRAFAKWLENEMSSWEIMLEQMLVYFVFTYFCGAVYDGNAFAKMRLSVWSIFLIYEMMAARWIKNEQALDMEDVVEIVYRYSREIEHSDENLRKLVT